MFKVKNSERKQHKHILHIICTVSWQQLNSMIHQLQKWGHRACVTQIQPAAHLFFWAPEPPSLSLRDLWSFQQCSDTYSRHPHHGNCTYPAPCPLKTNRRTHIWTIMKRFQGQCQCQWKAISHVAPPMSLHSLSSSTMVILKGHFLQSFSSFFSPVFQAWHWTQLLVASQTPNRA